MRNNSDNPVSAVATRGQCIAAHASPDDSRNDADESTPLVSQTTFAGADSARNGTRLNATKSQLTS